MHRLQRYAIRRRILHVVADYRCLVDFIGELLRHEARASFGYSHSVTIT
jgi:hypothetical protein